MSLSCFYCGKDSVCTCDVCGRSLCSEHLTVRAICRCHVRKSGLIFTTHEILSEAERSVVRKLVRRFWGEEEQLAFDRSFLVAELPSYVAKVKSRVAGFVSFSSMDNALTIVALGVLPKYQHCGIGSKLIEEAEGEARRLKHREMLVSTSNDDLPALGFYQSHGFQIYEVKPNVIAEKHRKVLRGLGGLPVRDELRLRKLLG